MFSEFLCTSSSIKGFSRSGLTATVEFSTARTNTTGLVLPLLLNGVKNVHQKTNDLVTKSEEQK
jgi:hypothetical protein